MKTSVNEIIQCLIELGSMGMFPKAQGDSLNAVLYTVTVCKQYQRRALLKRTVFPFYSVLLITR